VARSGQTRESLSLAASWLKEAARRLDSAIEIMESSTPPMESVLVHADSALNHFLPQIMAWSGRVLREAEDQKYASQTGMVSMAQREVERAQKQVKPPTKPHQTLPTPTKPPRKPRKSS
jgi:hypothetical protein